MRIHACLSYWIGNEISRENRYPRWRSTAKTACPPACLFVCLSDHGQHIFLKRRYKKNGVFFNPLPLFLFQIDKSLTAERYFALYVELTERLTLSGGQLVLTESEMVAYGNSIPAKPCKIQILQPEFPRATWPASLSLSLSHSFHAHPYSFLILVFCVLFLSFSLSNSSLLFILGQ